MKWLVMFLIILVMAMACDSNSDSIGADSSLADLEARVKALEREVWGFSTYPLEVFNSRIDQLERKLGMPSGGMPPIP